MIHDPFGPTAIKCHPAAATFRHEAPAGGLGDARRILPLARENVQRATRQIRVDDVRRAFGHRDVPGGSPGGRAGRTGVRDFDLFSSCRRPRPNQRKRRRKTADDDLRRLPSKEAHPQPPHRPMLAGRQGATVTPFDRWRQWRPAWRPTSRSRTGAGFWRCFAAVCRFSRVALGWGGWLAVARTTPSSFRFVASLNGQSIGSTRLL